MASQFREVFEDNLLVEPINADATCLPAPSQLKRKIILKVCIKAFSFDQDYIIP